MKLVLGLILGVPSVVYASIWGDTVPAEIFGAGLTYAAIGGFVCMVLLRSDRRKITEPMGRNGKMREMLNRANQQEVR